MPSGMSTTLALAGGAALALALLRRNTEKRNAKKDRAARWNDIYSRKGRLSDGSTPLHVLGGYDMYTLDQWVAQVALLCGPGAGAETTAAPAESASTFAGVPRRELGLKAGDRVLEVGVGGGAFVDALDRAYTGKSGDGGGGGGGGLKLHGVDYAPSLIDCVSARLTGRFAVADARDLGATVPWLRDGDAARVANFDSVVSFGVTQYLNSLADVGRMLGEMGRVARSGAILLVAEVSDLDKKALADRLRGKTHTSGTLKKVSSDAPTHLYVPMEFWIDAARNVGLEVVHMAEHTAIGLSYATAAYRYSVWLKKF
jgi:ubiquinone/menaquinone biosynthesis C-methylase UbiE